MDRDEAYKLLTEMLKSPNLVKHGLAVEAIMRSLCEYLKQRQIASSPRSVDMNVAPRNDGGRK